MPEPHLMRASDADRSGVAEVIQQAYVDGRLTRPELDERLAQVWQARTLGDLAPLTSDLVAGTAQPSGQHLAPVRGSQVQIRGGAPAHWVVLGEHKVVGVEWSVPDRVPVNVVLGEVHLDLANARFETDHVTVHCNVHLGSLVIYVPDHVRVVDATSKFLASIESKGMVQRNPRVTVTLTGLASIGSIELLGPEHRKYRKATGLNR